MRTLITLIIALTLTTCCHAGSLDYQYNTILAWNGTTPGKLIHRNIQFANAAETELQLGHNLNKHTTLFADFTHDNKDNQRLGLGISRKDSLGRWTLSSNLYAWEGLGQSQDRIKIVGTLSYKLNQHVSVGYYGLESRVNGRPHYLEYGPAFLTQTGHLNLNLYLLKKNSGHAGIEFDFRYNY